ncbi:TetR/AcrR family transcriptional regulator [Jatrophihabitans fulvus]
MTGSAHALADDDAARDGRSTRWDPHRRERRQTIIDAAVAAIEQHGPDVLTGQIAELAGVPRTHVYRHFDGKHALDLAVSAAIGNDLGSRIRSGLSRRGSARELIRGAVGEHLGWVEEHPNLYRFVAQHAYAVRSKTEDGEDAAADAKAAFAAELTTLVERYLRLLGVDAAPTERTIVGVVGLVDATAAWWLENGGPARDELTDELTERTWLLIDQAARRLGLELDPDQALPELT